MIAIVLDVLLITVLVFFTLRGAKKGFVLTLCSLVAVLVAIIGANLLADMLAPKVAQAIQPKLEQVILEQVNDALQYTEFVGTDGGVASSSEEVGVAGVL
ncbi:MAG: CvpA family protein, partial [Oscillospiraceae bacterium]|nr:CvpA family protein [Oscillospiraceae bacterium]